jgi:hypothetical protein
VRFIKLTNTIGEAIYLNPEHVMMVHPPLADNDSSHANAILVFISGTSQAVHENIADVMKLLGAAQ